MAKVRYRSNRWFGDNPSPPFNPFWGVIAKIENRWAVYMKTENQAAAKALARKMSRSKFSITELLAAGWKKL